ncbi:MAG TPA: peptide MFS transporter [Candidatus Binatus sp.]|nr:peptide MFS transporter [Candidatus Binatus sp.]
MTLLGHPAGLFLLFLVEMWERFSYYGMRGLLVLYLVQSTHPHPDAVGFVNPGRGWSRSDASLLYGWYTGLAYLFPVIGGWIADRLLGTHRSMVVGGLLIALGHLVLAASGVGSLAWTDAGMSVFVFGLALIVIGTGHFKPCVSVMVGQLYAPDDARRDGAFTIFYMGINLGAFLSAFVCGTLGERLGWHWGFGAAAIGMLAGLTLYLILRRRLLGDIGQPRPGRSNLAVPCALGGIVVAAVFAVLHHAGAFAALASVVPGPGAAFVLGALAVGWAIRFVASLESKERGPTVTIFVFMLFNAVFWLAFEQAGSSLNLFTDLRTNRMLGGFEIPTTWFQSVNAGLILLLAPLFAGLWSWLARRGRDPGQPVKIALGLGFLSLGYVFMVWASRTAAEYATRASMVFVLVTYFWHTVGELCLSPTGLSYVTKAAPERHVSFLMGLWFVSTFLANLGGGLVASRVEAIERGDIKLPWHLGGQADFFMLFVVSAGVASLLMFFLAPPLGRLARGAA